MEETPCVLSIQSHVVHGYVGNKSATFPLQVLGLEVDAINSVQFSNHTGYKVMKGQILNEDDLGELADGLAGNNINSYSYLLTGYVGNPAFLKRISQLARSLKKSNPGLIYVCDPVMGDNGRMYVPESLLPIYQEEILPLADIITPNQYEVELLTGRKLSSVEDAWSAIEELHAKGCHTVIISSSDLGSSDELLCLASSKKDGIHRKVTGRVEKLPTCFTGTGDLFSALLLGWMHRTGDIEASLNCTLATLQAVLKRTLSSAKAKCGDREPTIEDLELKLIESKKDIEEPGDKSFCRLID